MPQGSPKHHKIEWEVQFSHVNQSKVKYQPASGYSHWCQHPVKGAALLTLRIQQMGDKDWIVFGASLKWPFKELQIRPKKAFIKKIRKKSASLIYKTWMIRHSKTKQAQTCVSNNKKEIIFIKNFQLILKMQRLLFEHAVTVTEEILFNAFTMDLSCFW